MAKVSVIINCLNGEEYLAEAIDSVYAQSFQDWEIIFIDNASTDNTAAIAQSYDSRLKYINTFSTIPLYAARNMALEHIQSPFISFLDADDSWMPEKLAAQLEIMEKYPQVYLCCSGFLRKNERLNKVSKQVLRHSKFIRFYEALQHYPVNLSTVMLRYDEHSSAHIKFDPELNLTGDYELFLKLIHAYEAFYFAHPLAINRVHSTNLSARLVNNWPKEILKTHDKLIKELALTKEETHLLYKRFVKNCSLVHLANNERDKARDLVKDYFLKDLKLTLIYLFTFNHRSIKWLLNMRGF